MTDSIGYRMKFGVIAPSTNTSVQPEFEAMRPVGDENVRLFFEDCGYEVVKLKGLKCKSPQLIAHTTERELRDAIIEVNDPSVDAIVQAGTNLAMARVAAMAEFWLDKPVIAINTATYWWALRQNGINDKIAGFGALLTEH